MQPFKQQRPFQTFIYIILQLKIFPCVMKIENVTKIRCFQFVLSLKYSTLNILNIVRR